MAHTFRNDIYRSAKGLSYVVMAIFGGIALCSAFYILLSIVMIAAPAGGMSLADGSSINIWFAIIGLGAILEILLRVAVMVLFLIWEYRSFNNLSALKARNLEFSPGWAVGWWFIPFANLVKPFQVVREVYNESDPKLVDVTMFMKANPGTPAELGFWWATFLLAGFIYRLSDVFY